MNTAARFKSSHKSPQSNITVYPRIHAFSLDLSTFNGNMKSGSFGFPIKSIPVKISVKKSQFSHYNLKNSPKNLSQKIKNIVEKFKEINNISANFEVNVEIPANFRHHTGLGLTTQVLGGVIFCLYSEAGIYFRIDDFFKYNIGEVSALGAQLILNPSVIIEYGYKTNPSGKNLHPELYTTKESFEDFVLSFENIGWWAVVAIPKTQSSISGKFEDDFWRNIFPDKKENSLSIYYQVHSNLIPAIIIQDFERFIKAISKITSIGTKPVEENIQTDATKNAIKTIRERFGFAAISSLGPTIYSFSESDPEIPEMPEFEIIKFKI